MSPAPESPRALPIGVSLEARFLALGAVGGAGLGRAGVGGEKGLIEPSIDEVPWLALPPLISKMFGPSAAMAGDDDRPPVVST